MKLNYDVQAQDLIKSPARKIVNEFIESGSKIAAVDGWENLYDNVNSAYRNMLYAVKKQDAPAHTFIRKGRIYLERTDLDV